MKLDQNKLKKSLNICLCSKFNNRHQKYLFSNINIDDNRFTNKPNKLFICKKCSMIYLKIENSIQKKINKYYSLSNHFLKPGYISSDQKIRREGQVNWVIESIPNYKEKIHSILDIGSGSGYFLNVFKKKGIKNLLGIDFSKSMISFMKKKYLIKGKVGDFNKISNKVKYDLISCIQVLEHTINPKNIIKKAKKILNLNGYIFIEVPDSEKPRYNQLPGFYVFDHIYHFTEKSLCTLLENNGFEIISTSHIDNPKDSGNPFTALRVLARKRNNFQRRYIVDTRESLRMFNIIKNYKNKHNSYIKKFGKKIGKIKSKIKTNKYAIFCAGEHTNLLLSYFYNLFSDLFTIYDGDRFLSKKKVFGFTVSNSSTISKNNMVKNFIISSTNHEKEIFEFLKKINKKFKVYKLYN